MLKSVFDMTYIKSKQCYTYFLTDLLNYFYFVLGILILIHSKNIFGIFIQASNLEIILVILNLLIVLNKIIYL